MKKNTDINRYTQNSGLPGQQPPQGSGSAAWSITKRILGTTSKVILSTLLVLFLTGIIVGVTMLAYVLSFKDTSVDIDLKNLKLVETSYIYKTDTNGEQVLSASLHGQENRKWADLDEIPQTLQNAFIAIEDKRFKEHNGVDWQRTLFAAANLVTGWSENKQGGSTITQQLIKNLTDDNDVSIERKIREIFRALNLEKEYSKDEILEAYLNVITLGGGAYGVKAAAELYFDKDVSELNLIECAAIAGITQNPSQYNPITNPEANKKRRSLVLSEMLKQGMISQEEYDSVIDEELDLHVNQSSATSATKIQSYYTDMIINDVIEDLQETYDLSESAATTMIYQSGLRIYSAEDEQMQSICEEVYLNGASMPKDQKLQSGIIVMDYQGRVLATVGRRGEKTQNRAWNNAIDAVRQPGSAIKPISVYSYAVENNIVDWSTLIEDEPIELNGKKWPRNVYGYYRGPIPTQKALEISSNACAAQLALLNGMENSFYFMRDKMHISTAVEELIIDGKNYTDINLSTLATGGMTKGVTGIEMTAAFAVFGNNGKYYEPYSYYKVTDSEGNVLLDNTNVTYEQVISPASAGVMNKLLQAIVTGYEGTASLSRIPGWDIFGKTGTTSDEKDRWYIGGTPYCVASVWVGYEQQKKIPGYNHPAVPIWKEIMTKYLADKPKITYPLTDIEQHSYCVETGCFSTESCPEDQVKVGWFKKNSIVQPCEGHEGIESSSSEGSSSGVTSEESGSSSTAPETSSSSSQSSTSSASSDSSSQLPSSSQNPITSTPSSSNSNTASQDDAA